MRALLVLLALAGCRDKTQARTNEPTPEPLADTTRTQVDNGAGTSTGYIGVLTPKEQADVPAPFSTSVTKFLVEVGDIVEKDAQIALLDDAPIREALSIAAADLSGARVSASAAASALGTQRRAFAAGVASRSAVTEAQFALSEAGTKVQRAAAAHEAAKKKLTKTTLLAPIAGKVALHYVKLGAQVAEGNPVVRVISSDELFVKFAIPTDHGDKIKVGSEIDVHIDARGTKVTVKGTVRRIAPELDPIAQMIFAEADIETKGTALQAGSVCRIVVPATKR